jgi:NADH:ubiquinone oxidoreductase subunit
LAPVGAKESGPYSPRESWNPELMSFVKMLFSWWNSATLGTLLTTWTQGSAVGTDEFGNRYYQNKDGARRWVLYNGTVEASRVPPDWHGWLHHTFAEPPTKAPLRTQSWEMPHRYRKAAAAPPQPEITRHGSRNSAHAGQQCR